MLWSFLLSIIVTVIFQSTSSLKYEFMAITTTDGELPSFIPSNVYFDNNTLSVNTTEKGATFLTLMKPKSIPFSLYFKNDDDICETELELIFGGDQTVKIGLSCHQGFGTIQIANTEILELSNNEKGCSANLTMNSKTTKFFNSDRTKLVTLDKFDIEQNFEESNMSAISLAITIKIHTNPPSACSSYILFGSEHYLSAFQEVPEIITTTTETTTATATKKPATVSSTTKPPETIVSETSSNGQILWILLFIFSGTFAVACGGVAMFFFLRYREKRVQKEKKALQKSDDNIEVHTAKEKQQTPPKSKKSVAPPPPSKITTAKTKTSKSQPSKV